MPRKENRMEKLKSNRTAVLISGMLIQFCAGIIYMWSVFRNPVTEYLSWTAEAAAFTSSIMLTAFVLGIIIGGRAQDKIGPQKITTLGSLLIGIGMVLSAFVTAAHPWLIYVTYSVIAGFGVGCVYTCTVSTVQKWFPDKRGFATGMIVAAFGFSLVVFAPLAKSMLSGLGVKSTFLIFGISFLVVCTACSFLINPPSEAKASSVSGRRQYSPNEVLRTKQFYLLAFSNFFLLPAYFIINPLLISLGTERGLTEDTALIGVMITGIASASGRLLISWLSDKTGRKGAIVLIGVITILASAAIIFAKGGLFLVCVAAIAFAFGGSSGVYSAFSADLYGTKSAGQNFGMVMVAFALSSLLSPAIANMLSGTVTFIFTAVCALISAVLILLIKPTEQ